MEERINKLYHLLSAITRVNSHQEGLTMLLDIIEQDDILESGAARNSIIMCTKEWFIARVKHASTLPESVIQGEGFLLLYSRLYADCVGRVVALSEAATSREGRDK